MDNSLKDYRFIRLQSTACEQKRWEEILLTISDDFLMVAALGNNCIVYDYSSKRQIPRAIWQGLEWIKYVLMRRWYGQTYMPQGRAAKCAKYFDEQYGKISKRVKTRLDYFGKFTNGYHLRITAVTDKTDKDGQYDWFKRSLSSNLNTPAGSIRQVRH